MGICKLINDYDLDIRNLNYCDVIKFVYTIIYMDERHYF